MDSGSLRANNKFHSCLTFSPPAPKPSIVLMTRGHVPSILMINSLAVNMPGTFFGASLEVHIVCDHAGMSVCVYMYVVFVSRLNFSYSFIRFYIK